MNWEKTGLPLPSNKFNIGDTIVRLSRWWGTPELWKIVGGWYNFICLERWDECQNEELHIHQNIIERQ